MHIISGLFINPAEISLDGHAHFAKKSSIPHGSRTTHPNPEKDRQLPISIALSCVAAWTGVVRPVP
jgi:hypothetical protein